jgi:hypothetical protein
VTVTVLGGVGSFLLRGKGGSGAVATNPAPPSRVALNAATARPPKSSGNRRRPARSREGSRTASTNSNQSADRRAATLTAALKHRLQSYLDDFERYSRSRTKLSDAERSARLSAFHGQLDALLSEASRLEHKEVGLLSDVQRELGTLEWYQRNPKGARGYWRLALSTNPKNGLASRWLEATEGAVLKE